MAVTRTGDIYAIEAGTAQSDSQSVTVPVDCDVCVVVAGMWRDATNWIAANPVTLAGQNLTTEQKTDEQSDGYQLWIGYIVNPSTGSQTLAWNWGAAPSDPAAICCVFYAGVDTADAIEDSGEQLTLGADLTGLTASSGDMMVGGVYDYGGEPVVADEGQTELTIIGQGGEEYFAGFAQKDGGIGFYYTPSGGYGTCVALVLAQETGGPTDDLTADNLVAGMPSLGTPIIGQIHGLTASTLSTGAAVLAEPSIARVGGEQPGSGCASTRSARNRSGARTRSE